MRLELVTTLLRDSDVEIFLPHLSNLRILGLGGRKEKGGHLTDKCCKLISRTCQDLQVLGLTYQRNITVIGIKKLIKGCPFLRSINTSAKLQPSDVVSLVRGAPALVDFRTEHVFDGPTHYKMIEATEGRTYLRSFWSNHIMFNVGGLSSEIQDRYRSSIDISREVDRRVKDQRIINMWECPEVEELLMMRDN